MSRGIGETYRRTVLAPNGARPASEMVRDFLGRSPTLEAWLELRGLRAPSSLGVNSRSDAGS